MRRSNHVYSWDAKLRNSAAVVEASVQSTTDIHDDLSVDRDRDRDRDLAKDETRSVEEPTQGGASCNV
jgi:hypothetical protein